MKIALNFVAFFLSLNLLAGSRPQPGAPIVVVASATFDLFYGNIEKANGKLRAILDSIFPAKKYAEKLDDMSKTAEQKEVEEANRELRVLVSGETLLGIAEQNTIGSVLDLYSSQSAVNGPSMWMAPPKGSPKKKSQSGAGGGAPPPGASSAVATGRPLDTSLLANETKTEMPVRYRDPVTGQMVVGSKKKYEESLKALKPREVCVADQKIGTFQPETSSRPMCFTYPKPLSGRYEGGFAGFLPHGPGELETPTSVIKAVFKEGFPTEGTITYKDGRGFYQGHIGRDFHPNGQGELTLANGVVLKGTYNHGVISYGEIYIPDVGTYQGPIRGHQAHGNGAMTLLNGDIIFGEFKKGEIIGGTIRFRNGDVYEGALSNHQANGTGRLTMKDGQVLSGTFKNGVIRAGKVTFPDGSSYNGPLSRLKPHGKGELKTADGRAISGDFVEGVIKKGRILVDGVVYEGPISSNLLPNGVGVRTEYGSDCDTVVFGEFREEFSLNGRYRLRVVDKTGNLLLEIEATFTDSQLVPGTSGTIKYQQSNARYEGALRQRPFAPEGRGVMTRYSASGEKATVFEGEFCYDPFLGLSSLTEGTKTSYNDRGEVCERCDGSFVQLSKEISFLWSGVLSRKKETYKGLFCFNPETNTVDFVHGTMKYEDRCGLPMRLDGHFKTLRGGLCLTDGFSERTIDGTKTRFVVLGSKEYPL